VTAGGTIDLGDDGAQFLDAYFIGVAASATRGETSPCGAGHFHLMRGGEWREDKCRKLIAYLLERGNLRDGEAK
jgi:hypothetical protein